MLVLSIYFPWLEICEIQEILTEENSFVRVDRGGSHDCPVEASAPAVEMPLCRRWTKQHSKKPLQCHSTLQPASRQSNTFPANAPFARILVASTFPGLILPRANTMVPMLNASSFHGDSVRGEGYQNPNVHNPYYVVAIFTESVGIMTDSQFGDKMRQSSIPWIILNIIIMHRSTE